MKTKILLFLLLLCLNFSVQGQGVLNGSFENYANVGCAQEDYYICHATNWHILNNTPDVIHSSNSQNQTPSHAPRTGNGNARFASPPNGMDEYFYGSTNFSLTAGETYVVSFWVRKDYTTTENIPMGMHIGSSVPSPQLINPYIQTTVPQIIVTPTTTQYVRASTCFTPAVSGVHYLTFGAFGGNGTGEGQVWLVDDVSVRALEPGEGLQDANVTLPQTVYCVGDAIIADGSSSTDEIEYSWSINEIETDGSETNVYNGTLQQGQASTINVSQILSGANLDRPGHCFRVYLKVLNACTDQTFIDFCYDDPRFQFVGSAPVVCENVPIELEVTGDDGWLYEWSTGLTGTGEKTATVTPTAPSATYSVTVTTPAGCQHTETLTLTVSSLNGQVPPTMDGIDGTNGYTYYVNAGGFVDFTSTVFNNSGEIVTITPPTTLPPNISVDLPPLGSNGGTVTFEGQPGIGSEGVYDIILAMEDNNGCLVESNTYTFQIIVVCPTCPICWDYENRTPDHNPLAPENRMAKCILAGFTEPVIIGQGNHVLFQAGESIELSNNYFDTDGGTYDAIIEPTTCIDECNDCCDNWQGFTYDYIPPTVYINPWDDDPTNDFWQLTDIEHPLCSFGITGYRLVIASIEEDNIEDREYHTDHCCAFQTPSADWPWIEHSEIWWDNLNHQGPNQNEPVQPGDFIVHLWLYGCNGQEDLLEIHVTLYHNEYNMAPIGDDETETADNEARQQLQQQLAITEELKGEITLFPNPANDRITVQGLIEPNATVQLYDAKGVMLTGKTALDASGSYDVSKLSAGTYYLRVYSKGGYVAKRFEKL